MIFLTTTSSRNTTMLFIVFFDVTVSHVTVISGPPASENLDIFLFSQHFFYFFSNAYIFKLYASLFLIRYHNRCVCLSIWESVLVLCAARCLFCLINLKQNYTYQYHEFNHKSLRVKSNRDCILPYDTKENVLYFLHFLHFVFGVCLDSFPTPTHQTVS